MLTKSNDKPLEYYIDNMRDGKCDIVINTNITEIKDDEDNLQYEYKTDRIQVLYREGIEKDLKNDIDKYIKYIEDKNKVELENSIRQKRDNLLKSTDKYMLDDFPISDEDKQKYKRYREFLRNIPEQKEFPYNINWDFEEEV